MGVWNRDSPGYREARFYAKAWNWAKAASILNVTIEQVQEHWGSEMVCPRSGRTWWEQKAYIERLNAEALSPSHGQAI